MFKNIPILLFGLPQRQFCLLAFSNILRRSKHPDRISLIIADNVAQRMNNPLYAIRPTDSVIKTVCLFRLERSFDNTDHPVPIVRMNQFERLLAELNFLRLKPEDA